MTILFRMIRLVTKSVGIKGLYPFDRFLNAYFKVYTLCKENKKAGSTREPASFEIIILQR